MVPGPRINSRDHRRIANKERKPGQTPIPLTPEQIQALTRFAPTIRSWFPHAFRSEGQLKTQFVYLLEEVNPNTHKFILPPRVIHSNYPCLIGDHLVRVQEGSDPQDQQAQQVQPTTSDSVNSDAHPDRESESSFGVREPTAVEESSSPLASESQMSDGTNQDKVEQERVQWQMAEDRLELRRARDLNDAQQRQIAYQQEELHRHQAWIARLLELAEPFPVYLRRVLRLPPPRSVPVPAYLHDRLPGNPVDKQN
jgi:hypothetical protein